MTVNPIPDGYHTLTPYVFCKDVDRLLEFLQKAFDAEIVECLKSGDGTVMHAEAKIGDSHMMLSPGKGEWKATPASFYLYVPDTDALYRKAMAAGATSISEPADMFYGDRNAGVTDPTGNHWWIATHIEDVPPEELARRAAAQQGS